MCTLVLAHRYFVDAPLVVAANRDELLARPSSGPRVWPGSPRVLRPLDEVAGGSWLGLNQHGLFVGLTNRFGPRADPARRSRGELVVEALRARSAEALHDRLAGLRGSDFNPFHLLYGDGRSAFVTWSDGERTARYAVPSGVQVVTERSMGADDRGRTERLGRTFERLFPDPSRLPTLTGLRELLVLHAEPGEPMSGSCIHADALGYGTRSSFVYIGGEAPIAGWREGHPCEGALQPITPLLAELFEGSF